MKKRLLLFLISIFCCVCSVSALASSIGPISQEGNAISDGYRLALKAAGETPVFCSKFDLQSPAETGVKCTLTNDWSQKVRYGVAAIINSAKSKVNSNTITTEYFAAELAINRFLYNKGGGGANIDSSSLSATAKKLFDSYLSVANEAYKNFDTEAAVAITFSASKLTFTKSGDNYVSNNITVSGVDSFTVKSNIGTATKTGNVFNVTVPASSITETKTVTVTVSASKSFPQARNYDCGSYIDSGDYDGDGNKTENLDYQTLVPLTLETITKNNSEDISGSISPKGKLIINKVDSENKHLSGATITVTGTKGYSKTFTTTGAAITIENLEYDTYTITETKAPAGYVVAESKKVTLSSTSLTSTVTLTDNKNKVSISKTDATGKKELPGATLELQDSKGNKLHEWVSTTTPYIIEGLAPGKYYLIETIAPNGYVLSTEKVLVEIKETTVEEKVVMKNALNKIQITKISAQDKKALKGAVLQIEDEKGNIVKYCTDEKGNKNVECKWTTTEKAYEIEGMTAGKYYLVEVSAPSGYVLNKEKQEFTVKSTDKLLEIKMENELEVKVPDTLSSRSAILLAIAMFDIALGIGVITYVKKNKIKQ